LPAVFFDFRLLVAFAFAAVGLAFGLAFGGAARRARVAFLARRTRRAGIGRVTGEAGRAFTRGEAAAWVSLSADPSVSGATSPAGPSSVLLVFTGCHACVDPNALCLRNSRAASS